MKSVASVKIDLSKLRKLSGEIDPRAAQVIRKAIMDIEGDAKTLAPVDTGNLKNSGYSQMKNEALGEVGFTAEYAIYQEFGTRKMRAQPYLIPSLERHRASFLKAWKELIKQNERA